MLSAERHYCQRTDTPNRSLASGKDGDDDGFDNIVTPVVITPLLDLYAASSDLLCRSGVGRNINGSALV